MAGKSSCGTHYLTKISGSSSILQRIYETYNSLTEEFGEPPAMELVTDRPLDPNDPMMASRDQLTGLLVPDAMAGTNRSKLGKQRAPPSRPTDVDPRLGRSLRGSGRR